MSLDRLSPSNTSSLYEEVSLYWDLAYPSLSLPPSLSALLSTNLNHPLLDILWINYQVELFKSLEKRSEMAPEKLSISFSRFFDSVWYANLLYDAGIEFPESLYSDWVKRGLPNRVTVLTSGSFGLPSGTIKKDINHVFNQNANFEKIWNNLGSSEDTFLVSASWKVSV